MTAILRWFDHGGRRHRVWFRHCGGGRRELVVAGPDWQVGLADVADTPLEELTDRDLTELVERGLATERGGTHG